MYACICHGVPDHEVDQCIRDGAHSEDAIGEACQAGTGCGNCRDRLADMIESYFSGDAVSAAA
ncbi:(2Fe-2S)-binding protein [Glycomyces xiaoerkulensis]|uniref:(2Fe-2S)-binding protein n=1 Tax=Glycomyces xiaoerkulensis TaxID=2038139 RepID=UPI000C2594B2|nr:(2Fe-2S)-binding protein [Glycomyces xiaoerkulensis]